MHLAVECLNATSVPTGTVLMLRKQAEDPAATSDMTHVDIPSNLSSSIPGYGAVGSLNETEGRLMCTHTGIDRGTVTQSAFTWKNSCMTR